MLKILLLLIVLYGVYAFGGVVFGYKVKFLPNQTKITLPDTIRVKEVVFVSDTPQKKNQGDITKQPIIVFQPKGGKTEPIKDTTPKIQAKNVNTGTNNGIIGDDATVNVIDQPVLTEDGKKYILNKVQELRNKADTNIIFIFTGNGSNAGQFIVDLRLFLQKNGYIVEQITSLGSYSGIHFDVGPYMDNKTKIIEIYVGNLK